MMPYSRVRQQTKSSSRRHPTAWSRTVGRGISGHQKSSLARFVRPRIHVRRETLGPGRCWFRQAFPPLIQSKSRVASSSLRYRSVLYTEPVGTARFALGYIPRASHCSSSHSARPGGDLTPQISAALWSSNLMIGGSTSVLIKVVAASHIKINKYIRFWPLAVDYSAQAAINENGPRGEVYSQPRLP